MDIQAIQGQGPAYAQQAQQIQKAQQAAAAENPQAKPASQPTVPDYDQYEPQQASPSAGLYRVAHDGEGNPSIQFDGPADAPEKPDGGSPAPGKPAESCTTNTDRVDRELERLRKEQQALQQQLRAASPEASEKLQRRLDQVTRELAQKDNDGYRRQQAVRS